LLFLRTKY